MGSRCGEPTRREEAESRFTAFPPSPPDSGPVPARTVPSGLPKLHGSSGEEPADTVPASERTSPGGGGNRGTHEKVPTAAPSGGTHLPPNIWQRGRQWKPKSQGNYRKLATSPTSDWYLPTSTSPPAEAPEERIAGPLNGERERAVFWPRLRMRMWKVGRKPPAEQETQRSE